MSTSPTPETTAPQAPPARKALPPRVLLISGLLAAAVIGTAGYLATRNMASPADLTATPMTTTPSVTTTTPATSAPTTATAPVGSTPQNTKPTATTTAAATTTNDPDRVRDPFAPAEDGNGTGNTNGSTVATPTTRPAPTAAAQTLPVQSASATLPVTRSAPEQAAPAQRQASAPVILPITPAAVLPPSVPAVTLTPSTPQTSTTVTAPVRTLPVPVTPPATIVTIPTPAATTTTAPTTTALPQTQAPVQTPQPTAPALNIAQQWLRDNQVTYGGRADSGETTTVILNTKDGQVFADVGERIPGTDVTVTSLNHQNLVFTLEGKAAKLTLPASPATDTGAQP